MRKLLVLSLIAVTVVAASTAQAESKKSDAIHVQLTRFYHADGFIKSIGHVAYRTIYSPNDKTRISWKRTLHRLVLVRIEARAKIDALRAPPLPPHYSQWVCIHGFEGSWTDSGGPYYGGLQMDLAFQAAYGRTLLRTKGTADHWTPLEQMWVAEHAWQSRGFWPWPNTAHYCGLL